MGTLKNRIFILGKRAAQVVEHSAASGWADKDWHTEYHARIVLQKCEEIAKIAEAVRADLEKAKSERAA